MEGPARDLREYRRAAAAKRTRLALVLLLLLALTGVWRVTRGEWDIPVSRVAGLVFPFLSGEELSSPEALVVRAVRLPRFLAAAGTGGLLAVSGAVLQGLLANPLAEPYTLGIASGAAFGGALGFFLGPLAVAPAAFAGALFALWLAFAIAWRSGGGGAYIVLAGIITNAVLSAGVTFLKAIADDKLGAIVLWLMGSLSGASPSSALTVWAGAAFVFIPSFIYGRRLDAVSLGDGRGELLGVDERRLRATLLFFSSVATACAVSCFGIIGFVGLVVPHLLRVIVGPSSRPLIVFSFLGGALLLSAADGLAQRMGELPVGVITALIGGPFFCWILARGRRGA